MLLQGQPRVEGWGFWHGPGWQDLSWVSLQGTAHGTCPDIGCSEPVCNLLVHVCPMPLVLMVIGGVRDSGPGLGGISTAVPKHK
eukprot:4674153-Alexandrium_andersonii.AAC.1